MAYDFPNTPTTGQIVTLGSAQWQWDGVKWASLPGPVLSAQRNVIHNPYFNIQQRGLGPWTSGSGIYTADRWAVVAITDTGNIQIVALADSDRATIGDEAALYAYQAVFAGSSTSGAYTEVVHNIENVRRLSGKTVTISFWARATSGTPRIGIGYYQGFGSGGSPSPAVNHNIGVTPALSTTWQRYTFTGTLPSAAGKTFGTTVGTDFTQIQWWLSDQGAQAAASGGIGQQSGTVQFWGMQLEVGNAATPLEKIDPQFDLANCQRFYQTYPYVILSGWQTGGVLFYTTFAYPVTMRISPTVVYTTPNYSNTSGVGTNSVNNTTLTWQATMTATGAGWCVVTSLTLSADL